MNIVEKILERVKGLMADMAFCWGKMDTLAAWDSLAEIKANWAMLVDLAPRVVLCVEFISSQLKAEVGTLAQSAEKRAAAVAYLDALLVLPPYLEWLDNMILGYLVDSVVAALNKRYGKDWGATSHERLAKLADGK